MKARTAAAASLVALALVACDLANTPQTPGVWLDVGTDGVEFGRAFPVTVSRVWPRKSDPEDWDDAALAPLAVRATGVRERTDADRTSETRTFDGYAFRAGDVEVPAAKTTIRVKHAVDPASPGSPELPGDPIAVPQPLWLRALGVVAALALVVTVVRRLLRKPPAIVTPSPVEVAPPPRPDAIALAALASLSSRGSEAPVHAETATILREYVRGRFGVAAIERTTEELAADARIDRRAELASLLTASDFVKFACEVPSAAAREHLLAGAATFVRATALAEVATA